MSTVRPSHTWPLILCGPMLRRVTPDEVCVFIALRQPARVRLRLYTDADGSNPVSLTPPAARMTLALGRRLHVAVARERPLPPLLPGLRYHYDIEITRLRDGIETSDTLRSLNDDSLANGSEFASDGPNLLHGDFPLGYQPGSLPGFRIATGLDDLAILHASCRKPHGEGPDMLALADDILVERPFSSIRPHQLILTGDQIYADDVALGLAQIIAATAPELMTADPARRVPELDVIGGDDAYHGELPEAAAALADDPYGRAMNDASLAPGERRARFATGPAGFSVELDHAFGHLLYLGEFYAMYLLAWSPALWPVDGDGEPLLGADPTPLSEDEDRRADLTEKAAEERPRLQAFFHALPKVRRALANIPTLMMFDDHEVTDDWNLSAPTAERVQDSPSGRQVVRNALAAYAVFQDWGNRPSVAEPGQPAAYEEGEPGAVILEALRCPDSADGPLHPSDALPPLLANGGSDTRRDIEDRFGLRRHIAPAPPTMAWHYCVRFPSHLLIALDTRTRRLLPADGGPAAIIDPAHMTIQLDAPRTAYPGVPTLIVAPGPVFDLPPTELIKDGLGKAVRITIGGCGEGLYEFIDRETWSGHRGALRAMVEHLIPFGSVVLLSGDIHYAFSNTVAAVNGDGERGRIVQLCSSASKHEDVKTRLAIPALLHTGNPDRPLRIVLGEAPGFIDALIDRLELVTETARGLGTAGAALATDTLTSRLRLALAQSAGLVPRLPLAEWAGRAEYDPISALDVPTDTTRCLIHYLRAEGDAMRPCDEPWAPGVAGTPSDGAPMLDHRQAVGINNIGLVRFDTPGQVRHTLYWFSRNTQGGLIRLWSTEHRAPLTVPAANEV